MREKKVIEIKSDEYWVKVLGMLNQNWALIEKDSSGDKVTVFFIADTSKVFDQLHFESDWDAQMALRNNGFRRVSKDGKMAKIMSFPMGPFIEAPRKIYSSGEFWK